MIKLIIALASSIILKVIAFKYFSDYLFVDNFNINGGFFIYFYQLLYLVL
jgi:hypothetical protein